MSARFGVVPHMELLAHFGQVAARPLGPTDDAAALVRAREVLHSSLGQGALLDAAGIVGMFSSITRVVDLTGHKSVEIRVAARVTTVLSWMRQHALHLGAAAAAAAAVWWLCH